MMNEMSSQLVSQQKRKIDDSQNKQLCESDSCNGIKKLRLSNNLITFEGAKQFQKQQWQNLTHIYLTKNIIGNIGCKHLSKAKFQSLEELWLGQNSIENVGLCHLSKAQWKHIRKIWLSDNLIRADLYAKVNWKELSQIVLGYNRLTEFDMISLMYFSSSQLTYASFTNNKLENFEKLRIRTLFRAKFIGITIYV